MGSAAPPVAHEEVSRVPLAPGRCDADLRGPLLAELSHQLHVQEETSEPSSCTSHPRARKSTHFYLLPATPALPSLFLLCVEVRENVCMYVLMCVCEGMHAQMARGLFNRPYFVYWAKASQ